MLEALRRTLARQAGPDSEFDGVWPENWPTVQAFLCAGSQWRYVAAGQRLIATGLDYAGAKAGIEAAGLSLDPDIWEGLRVMEAAAREVMNRDGP